MNKKQSEQNSGSALPPRSPNSRISPHASQVFSKSGTPHHVIDHRGQKKEPEKSHISQAENSTSPKAKSLDPENMKQSLSIKSDRGEKVKRNSFIKMEPKADQKDLKSQIIQLESKSAEKPFNMVRELNNKIVKKVKEIDKLKMAVSQLENLLETNKREQSITKNKNCQLHQNIETLQRSNKELFQKYVKLSNQHKNTKQSLEQTKKYLSRVEEQLNRLKKENSIKEKTIHELSGKTSEIIQKNSQIQNLSEQLNFMHSSLQIKDNTIKGLTSAIQANVCKTWEYSNDQPTINVSNPDFHCFEKSSFQDSGLGESKYFEEYVTFLDTEMQELTLISQEKQSIAERMKKQIKQLEQMIKPMGSLKESLMLQSNHNFDSQVLAKKSSLGSSQILQRVKAGQVPSKRSLRESDSADKRGIIKGVVKIQSLIKVEAEIVTMLQEESQFFNKKFEGFVQGKNTSKMNKKQSGQLYLPAHSVEEVRKYSKKISLLLDKLSISTSQTAQVVNECLSKQHFKQGVDKIREQ